MAVVRAEICNDKLLIKQKVGSFHIAAIMFSFFYLLYSSSDTCFRLHNWPVSCVSHDSLNVKLHSEEFFVIIFCNFVVHVNEFRFSDFGGAKNCFGTHLLRTLLKMESNLWRPFVVNCSARHLLYIESVFQRSPSFSEFRIAQPPSTTPVRRSSFIS
jgi:hypothetical protein